MDAVKIDLNFQQIMEAVKQLSPADKLKLNGVIWQNDVAIPIEHQILVAERIESARKHPELLLDWDEVSKSLL